MCFLARLATTFALLVWTVAPAAPANELPRPTLSPPFVAIDLAISESQEALSG